MAEINCQNYWNKCIYSTQENLVECSKKWYECIHEDAYPHFIKKDCINLKLNCQKICFVYFDRTLSKSNIPISHNLQQYRKEYCTDSCHFIERRCNNNN